MRFVQDGEHAACLASVQVSTRQRDQVAGPARWAGIARAATVAADGLGARHPGAGTGVGGPTGLAPISAQLVRGKVQASS